MIQFSLNNINVSDNVSDYKFSSSPMTEGNSFVTANGEEVNNIIGYKYQLNISLAQLDTELAEEIIEALNSEQVTISSNAGTIASGTYKTDGGYNVNLVKSSRGSAGFSGEWEISFSASRFVKKTDGL